MGIAVKEKDKNWLKLKEEWWFSVFERCQNVLGYFNWFIYPIQWIAEVSNISITLQLLLGGDTETKMEIEQPEKKN